MTAKNWSYAKINSLDPLYLIINKINGCIRGNNGNKHLALVPTNESKYILKMYEELWNKFRDHIRSITINSDDYEIKYMKSKFSSDGHYL